MKLFFLSICLLTHLIGSENVKKCPSHFIWSYGISSQADVAPFKDLLCFMSISNKEAKKALYSPPYTNIKCGQLIWLHPIMLSDFIQNILPTLDTRISLIVNNSDHGFPSVLSSEEFMTLMNHKNIMHIFAQNCDLNGTHEKLTQLPIGLDYHTGINRGTSAEEQERKLQNFLLSLAPTNQRIRRIFVDFQHNDTSGQRVNIFNQIVSSGLVDYYDTFVSRDVLWETKGKYAFSVSPHGNGLDCHRTWEDLILGCIVIVKTSTLDELYEGLPVVIVQDWDEINSENLHLWLEQYGDAFNNPVYREKLTNEYWLRKIKEIINSKLGDE